MGPLWLAATGACLVMPAGATARTCCDSDGSCTGGDDALCCGGSDYYYCPNAWGAVLLVCCAFCAGLCRTWRKHRDRQRAIDHDRELSERVRASRHLIAQLRGELVALQPQVVAAIAVTDNLSLVDGHWQRAAEAYNPHRGLQRQVRVLHHFD